jgi:uncharacterized protein DUF4349
MLTTALLFGCTSERAAPQPEDQAAALFVRQEREGYAPSRNRAEEAFPADKLALGEIPEVGIAPLPDIVSNMIIRTATASVQVDSLEPAVALVRELATRLGGYVGSSGIVTGKNQLRQAVIEVKVPAARFDEVLSGLAPIGKLESVNVTAQDVGEEFVDVTARMDNARRLERRLIDLLATRTGKLKDVLDVERELARVREEIDRYEGRLRYLKAHTAMSTLSITVHEPMPVVGTAGKSVMGEAFTQAWRNFVVLLSLAVQSLGVVLPLGLIAAVAWVVTRRWRLARQRTA